MATVTQQGISRQTRAKIYSPLHKLRGRIRTYILLEAAATFIIFLAICFWLGLALDFGAFKLFGLDWVQLFPTLWFRFLVLVVFVVLLVLVPAVSLMRLLRRFRPEALALVLEKRFPKLLGDRLITAVELSRDLQEAHALGYSRDMILETVRQVSERVDQVPVGRVFNWGRLRNRWLLAGGLSLGIFLLVLVAYCIRYNRTGGVVDFGYRFSDVVTIWGQRNFLLQNTLWPRRSFLELVDFPESGEMRIQQGGAARVRVVAREWVVADKNVAGGWRAMTWADVEKHPDWAGVIPKRFKPPGITRWPAPLNSEFYLWLSTNKSPFRDRLHAALKDKLRKMGKADSEANLRNDAALRHQLIAELAAAGDLKEMEQTISQAPSQLDPYWTVDRMQWALDQPECQDGLIGISSQDYESMRGSLDRLAETAGQARMSRTMRRLTIPASVTMTYWGEKTNSDMPLTKQQELNEFSCVLNDLKESVRFYVRGEDFYTYPSRKITLVPPPMLIRLERDEYVPAYLYHRAPADGKLDDLKGQKQVKLNQPVSLTGSTSRLEFPSGTDIVLRGETDKELTGILIRYRTAAKPGVKEITYGEVEALPVAADHKSFEKRFEHITRPVEFDFEFTDTDNVKSQRHIIIQPVEDRTPEVNVAVEVIRKTPNGYMCTDSAMIPFSGSVRDDYGLTKVEYVINYSKVETQAATNLRAMIAAGVLGTASPSPLPFEIFTAPALADLLGRLSESRESAVPMPPIMLSYFDEVTRDKNREFRYGKAQLVERLTQPPPANAQIRQFDVKPDLDFLDLLKAVPDFQKGKSETIRSRYRMRVSISATDNNIETGPRIGQSRETFTFLVVPYEELLGELNKEEEALSNKMNDLYFKMQEVRDGIDKVIERMPKDAGSDEFRASASRMQELEEGVAKGRDIAQELLNDYNRLLKEVQMNRVPESFIRDKETVCNMLDEAIRNHFQNAEEAHKKLRQVFEERRPPEPPLVENSKQRQLELVLQLKQILDKVGGLLNATKLAERLTNLIKQQLIVQGWLESLKIIYEDDLFTGLGDLQLKCDPIEVSKGERVVVKMDVIRDANIEGELSFRFTPPAGSSLEVPKVVYIERKADKAQFELTAGSKPGEFTIPVEVFTGLGKPFKLKEPFQLKVRVK
ncbi:MAG TPA: hypothetical protein VKS79_12735 [Gemmataceae bacterium]|nr:hypothetical protein [Gemmataceae bacterium]